jgi:hypothetical protein
MRTAWESSTVTHRGLPDECDSAQVIGWETLPLAADSVRALHIKATSGERRLAEGVPFGLVKQRNAGEETVLTGYGTGAKGRISGTPLPLTEWMARLESASAPPDSNVLQDRSRAGAVVAALCDSLTHSALLQPDSLAPAVTVLMSIAGVLPGIEQDPERVPDPGVGLHYPEQLRRQGIEGRVVMEAILDTTGYIEPQSFTVTKASNEGFVLAVQAIVVQSRFKPARICGRAIRTLIAQPFDFRLRR